MVTFTVVMIRLVKGLQAQNAAEIEVKILQGILPICSHCKKIRKKDGLWIQLESYVKDHAEVDFTHGICPECMGKHYSEYLDEEN
jgi:hypothetical protein